MDRQEALKEIRFMVYLERKQPVLEFLYFLIRVYEDPDYWEMVNELLSERRVK
jgi:hypothetical protein